MALPSKPSIMSLTLWLWTAGTLQWQHGCMVEPGGLVRGWYQFAYDGADFLLFDTDNERWLAPSRWAEVTQHRWSAQPDFSRYVQRYLTDACVEWLGRFLHSRRAWVSRHGMWRHRAGGMGIGPRTQTPWFMAVFPMAVGVRSAWDQGMGQGEGLRIPPTAPNSWVLCSPPRLWGTGQCSLGGPRIWATGSRVDGESHALFLPPQLPHRCKSGLTRPGSSQGGWY